MFEVGNTLGAKTRIVDGMIRSVLATDDRGKLRKAIEVTLDKASNGCLASLDWIACRLEGKANQQVNVDSTLAIMIESERPRLTHEQWLRIHDVIDANVINELAAVEQGKECLPNPLPVEAEQPL